MKRRHPQREDSKQELGELHVNRGYIKSPVVDAIIKDGGQVVCRPWVPHDDRLFTKRHFTINRRDRTITCPAGKTERFTTGTAVEFNPNECARCALRLLCSATVLDLETIHRIEAARAA